VPAQKNLMITTATPSVLAHWLKLLGASDGGLFTEGSKIPSRVPKGEEEAVAKRLIDFAPLRNPRAMPPKHTVPGWEVWSLGDKPGVELRPAPVVPRELAGTVYGTNTTGLIYGGH